MNLKWLITSLFMSDGTQGACAVCGQGLKGRLVLCRRCGTRYHNNCWDYNEGLCAVYGCTPPANPRRDDLRAIAWAFLALTVLAASMLVWIWRIISA